MIRNMADSSPSPFTTIGARACATSNTTRSVRSAARTSDRYRRFSPSSIGFCTSQSSVSDTSPRSGEDTLTDTDPSVKLNRVARDCRSDAISAARFAAPISASRSMTTRWFVSVGRIPL
jgi:hypothetical protein